MRSVQQCLLVMLGASAQQQQRRRLALGGPNPCCTVLHCRIRSCCSDDHDHPESPPLGRSRYLKREEDDMAAAPAGSRELESVSLDSPR